MTKTILPAVELIAVLALMLVAALLMSVMLPVLLMLLVLKACALYRVSAPMLPVLDKLAMLLLRLDRVRLPAPVTSKPQLPSLIAPVRVKLSPLGALMVAAPVMLIALLIVMLVVAAAKVVPAAIATVLVPRAALLATANVPALIVVAPV